MGPLAQSEGHDAPGLFDELVPGEAAVVDDVIVGLEDAVLQPVVAHELSDVLAVAAGNDDAGGFTFGGTDRAEQPCRGVPLILGCRGPRDALRPAPGELGLLTDASLVLPPQLYRRSSRQAPPDLRQAGSEAF